MRASLEALRLARAPRAVALSFEAQIYWFEGRVGEARQAFEHLLMRHGDYCHGLTIENDLAVMCFALGDLAAAEEMSRRSLLSWAGIAHTQALSSLVLGATLAAVAASRGDSAKALDAAHRLASVAREAGLLEWLCEALTLAQAQGFGWLITRLDGAA